MREVKKRFLSRMLITYTVLVCSLIMMIFSGFVIRQQKNYEKERKQLDNARLSDFVENFDRSIDHMLYFSSGVKNIHALDLFALSSQVHYYQRMTELYNDLSDAHMLLAEEQCHVLIHKQNDTTVLTDGGSSNIYQFLERFQVSIDEYRQITAQLGRGRTNKEQIIVTDVDLIYITQKDLMDTKVIIVLYSDLEDLGMKEDSILPVSWKSEDPRVLDRRSDPPDIKFEQEVFQMEDGKVQSIMDGKESYECRPSSYYDIVFYYPSSYTASDGEIRNQILGFGFLSVLVCAVACIIVAIISLRLYRPIGHIVNTLLLMEDSAVTAESQNELDYLTHRVVQIRQQNQSLTELLDDNNCIFREKLVNDVLQGSIDDKNLPGLLEKYGMRWLEEETVIVLFSFSDTGVEYTGNEKITEGMLKLLEEQLQKEYKLQFIQPSRNAEEIACCILHNAEPNRLKQQLHEITMVIDTAFQISFYAFVGPLCNNCKELHSAYFLLSKLADNYRRLPIKNIYDISDLEKLKVRNAVYPLSLEMKLVQAVAQNNKDDVFQLLKRIYTEYITPAFLEKESKETMIFALINTLNRAAQQSGVDFHQLNDKGDILFIELKLCKTSEELYKKLCFQFQKMMKKTANTQQMKEINLKDEMESYLQQNLSKDISLLDLAEQFHLSPNYMSMLFKTTTGSNFKDYLSQLRFERARQILDQQPDIKLAELGEQVGIPNVNTLIRIFKKYSGMSPGQYRHK